MKAKVIILSSYAIWNMLIYELVRQELNNISYKIHLLFT
jgi:hypothetical protein